MIIGLSGFAQSGKDCAAAHLVAQGWVRVAFADPLREMLYALNPVIDHDIDGEFVDVVDLVSEVGWERAKKNPEVRRLLQAMGTEAGRAILGQDCWVDLAERKIKACCNPVVLTDVRFANEAQRIKDMGGKVVRVVRPGIKAVNAHVSETSVPDSMVDLILVNGGSIEDLRAEIDKAVSLLT